MKFWLDLKLDDRPSKNGWFAGGYFCKCINCNGEYIGSKGSRCCSDCAYDFDEQLQYESLWREVGKVDCWRYVMRKYNERKVNGK